MTPLRFLSCLLMAAIFGAAVAVMLHKRDEIDASREQRKWLRFQATCDQRGGLATQYDSSLLCLKPQSILDLESR